MAVGVLLILGCIIWALVARRKRGKVETAETHVGEGKDRPMHELGGAPKASELGSDGARMELETPKPELEGKGREIDATRHELPARPDDR